MSSQVTSSSDDLFREYNVSMPRFAMPDEVQPWLQLIRETEQEEEDEFLLQVSDNLQTEEEEEKILLLASEMF